MRDEQKSSTTFAPYLGPAAQEMEEVVFESHTYTKYMCDRKNFNYLRCYLSKNAFYLTKIRNPLCKLNLDLSISFISVSARTELL